MAPGWQPPSPNNSSRPGKAIIIHTLELFQNDPEIDAIEIVCIRSHMDTIREMTSQYGITKLRWVCEGGSSYRVCHQRDELPGPLLL